MMYDDFDDDTNDDIGDFDDVYDDFVCWDSIGGGSFGSPCKPSFSS